MYHRSYIVEVMPLAIVRVQFVKMSITLSKITAESNVMITKMFAGL